MKTLTEIRGRYASMERGDDGTWSVFNDVTGLLVKDGLAYPAAKTAFDELQNHYQAIERGQNGG